MAEITGWAVCGGDPEKIWEAGAAAAEKLLREQGCRKEEFAAFEILENSGADVLAIARALGLPEEKINRKGGALGFGLPGGAEGLLMLERLLGSLKAGEKGLLIAYSPGGLGAALAVQK